MRIYKLSKRSLIFIYTVLGGSLLLIIFAVKVLRRYVTLPDFVDDYVLLPLWVIAAVFAVLMLPGYYRRTRFTVTSKEITVKSGIVVISDQFIPTSSVKSVTTVLLPLGRITGLNFIILNCLGARVVLPCLSRRDALEITALVENTIRSRNG